MSLPRAAADLVQAAIAARDPYSAAGAYVLANEEEKRQLEQIMFTERRNALMFARWEHTPPQVLMALSKSGDASVQLRLDRNPGTPALALCSLYGGTKQKTLVELIARHSHTPSEILEGIADHDTEAACLKAISQNQAASAVALRMIEERVSARFDSELAVNPGTPADVLERLYGRGDGYVRAAVIAHASCPPALLQRAASDTDVHVLRQLAHKPDLDAALLERLAKHVDAGVRRGAAGNTAISQTLLAALACDASSAVRRAMAARADLPLKLMKLLAVDDDNWVRQWLARNPMLPVRMMGKLATDSEMEVRRAVARNPKCPGRLLKLLSEDASPWVRSGVAYQPNASAYLLSRLAQHEEVDVLSGVASNAHTPQKILQRLVESEEADVRRGVILNRSAKRSTLLPLLQDPYYLHRMLLIGNKELNLKDKWGLHDDPDHSVRFVVFKWFSAQQWMLNAG